MPFSLRYSAYAALAFALLAAGAWMSAPTPDEVAVRAALDHYIQGHATGDGAHMRLAFNPAARLFWSSADTLATRSADEYIARMPGKPAADRGDRRPQAQHRARRRHGQCGHRENRARLSRRAHRRLHVVAQDERRVADHQQNLHDRE